VFGEEALPDLLEINRVSCGGIRLVDRVGGELKQLLRWKRVVPNGQGAEGFDGRIEALTTCKTVQSDSDGVMAIFAGGLLLGTIFTTLGRWA
jgi:hypothetical protein